MYDDRIVSIGKKLSDNELIGIPHQIIIGKNTLKDKLYEIKNRKTNKIIKLSLEETMNYVGKIF